MLGMQHIIIITTADLSELNYDDKQINTMNSMDSVSSFID